MLNFKLLELTPESWRFGLRDLVLEEWRSGQADTGTRVNKSAVPIPQKFEARIALSPWSFNFKSRASPVGDEIEPKHMLDKPKMNKKHHKSKKEVDFTKEIYARYSFLEDGPDGAVDSGDEVIDGG